MTELLVILLFTTFYGLGMIGGGSGGYSLIAGFLVNVGYIIYRWSFLGRAPVTERFDILIVMAAIVGASFFYFRKRVAPAGLYTVLPLVVVILCFFALFQERMDTIEPNMNSPWFYLYSALFIAGYALLTAGSAAGAFALMEQNASSEAIQYRLTLLGWLLFSLALIAGSVWFFRVHGAYWLWTAKELWITITWFYYGFYLHARMVKPLAGRTASVIGAAGFGVMLFSYLGVTPILGSPWSQF